MPRDVGVGDGGFLANVETTVNVMLDAGVPLGERVLTTSAAEGCPARATARARQPATMGRGKRRSGSDTKERCAAWRVANAALRRRQR